MTVVPGVDAVKTDPAAELLGLSQEQRTSIRYEVSESDQVPQVKHTPRETINLRFPVDDVSELSYLQPVEQQFARANRNHVQIEPDQAIIELLDWGIAAENTTWPDNPIDKRRLKAIAFHDAHRMNSYPTLAEHLRTTPETADLLGFPRPVDQSTLRKTLDKVDHSADTIENTGLRVRHAIARNGILPHNWPTPSPIPYDPTSKIRVPALLHWGQLFFSEIIPSNLFNRADNRQYSTEEIIGTTALGAVANGLANGPKLVQFLSPTNRGISRRRLSQLLDSFLNRRIEQMEETLHQRMLRLIKRTGLLEQPQQAALDGTWVSYGDETTDKGGQYMIPNPDNPGKNAIHIVGVTSVNSPSQFSFGVAIPSQKDNRPQLYHRILRRGAQHTKIKLTLADREFTGAPTIKHLREVVESQWIIRAKRIKGSLQEFRSNLSKGESATTTDISLQKLSYGANAFAYPDDDGGHYVYLSGLSPDEYSPAEIHRLYQGRWGIETFYRLVKHDFGLRTRSPRRTVRLFLWTLRSIFYNLYSLAKRSVTPRIGIPLDPKPAEVLFAIAFVGLGIDSHKHPNIPYINR